MPRMALYRFLWGRAESLLDSYRYGSKASRLSLETLRDTRGEEWFLLALVALGLILLRYERKT